MASDAIKRKIKDALRKGFFQSDEDFVYVGDSDASEDDVHLLVVSEKFRGKRLREKTDLIWSELTRSLGPEDWGRVTLSVGVDPVDVMAI